jgi:DNA-directed RNA polymerase specialized sigma24 family protein
MLVVLVIVISLSALVRWLDCQKLIEKLAAPTAWLYRVYTSYCRRNRKARVSAFASVEPNEPDVQDRACPAP